MRKPASKLIQALSQKTDIVTVKQACERTLGELNQARELEGVVHPFGFVMFTLASEDGDPGVRMHIWPKDHKEQSAALLVHDHIYSFRSLVVSGELTEFRFDARSASESEELVFYEVEYENGTSILTKTNTTVEFAIRSKTTHRAGTYYEIARGELHRVRVPEAQICATLLLTSAPDPALKPRVAGPLSGADRISFRREPVSEDYAKALIRAGLGINL